MKDALPALLRAELERALRTDAPVPIALARLLSAADSRDDGRNLIAELDRAARHSTNADARRRAYALGSLAMACPDAWRSVRAMRFAVDHSATGDGSVQSVARIAKMFDDAVRRSEIASVALYALGDERVLAAATAETVDFLSARGFFGCNDCVLDLGCGIGRFLEALAARVAAIVGVEVSALMAERAAARCRLLPNVSIIRAEGCNLSYMSDRSFDSILAIDCFPYFVQAGGGLAERYVTEAARTLKEGGRLAILNYSYRDDRARDEVELRRAAERASFAEVEFITPQFYYWDATAWLCRK